MEYEEKMEGNALRVRENRGRIRKDCFAGTSYIHINTASRDIRSIWPSNNLRMPGHQRTLSLPSSHF